MESLRGRLLVATAAIAFGPFHRSVVYLLDHDAEGALGVILNQPLDAEVDDILPEWGSIVTAPDCLFGGGPVGLDSALAIGIKGGGGAPTGWQPMSGNVGLVDLDGPAPMQGTLSGLRVFAGYAGWSAGQLDEEIIEGSWMVIAALDDDLTTHSPERLWREVLRRQDSELRLWSTFPLDPNDN